MMNRRITEELFHLKYNLKCAPKFSFSLKRFKRDYRFGKCSGFPLCCVLFYCIIDFIPKLLVIYNHFNFNDRAETSRVSYVRCPICHIRHKVVNIIRCTECTKTVCFNPRKKD
jgi:hypothetical protein